MLRRTQDNFKEISIAFMVQNVDGKVIDKRDSNVVRIRSINGNSINDGYSNQIGRLDGFQASLFSVELCNFKCYN